MSKTLIRQAHQIANIALLKVTVKDLMRRLRKFLSKVRQCPRREHKRIERLEKKP